jgi:hypothetical protein
MSFAAMTVEGLCLNAFLMQKEDTLICHVGIRKTTASEMEWQLFFSFNTLVRNKASKYHLE